jgi:hypothetical protein
MNDAPEYDPIHKAIRQSPNVWAVWMKNGEGMTWPQRIGFALISFCSFSSGLLFATLAIGSLRNGDLFSLESIGAAIGVVAGICFLIVGILGLRNVLRF